MRAHRHKKRAGTMKKPCIYRAYTGTSELCTGIQRGTSRWRKHQSIHRRQYFRGLSRSYLSRSGVYARKIFYREIRTLHSPGNTRKTTLCRSKISPSGNFPRKIQRHTHLPSYQGIWIRSQQILYRRCIYRNHARWYGNRKQQEKSTTGSSRKCTVGTEGLGENNEGIK